MYRIIAALVVSLLVVSHMAEAAAPVEIFSPQGEVKNIRQVTARFVEQMVAFGDPREVAPFDINCPEQGQGRWADGRNWVYDFERDLPAGVKCTFSLKDGLKSLSGSVLPAGQSYSFNTGGPAIVQQLPNYWEQIDEEQIFILGLDAPAKPDTIAKNAWCSVGGINERIPVKLLTGEKRRQVLDVRKEFMDQYFKAIAKIGGQAVKIVFGISVAGSEKEKFLKLRDDPHSPIVVLQCQRPFPNETEVKLMWGPGIESISGIPTSQMQSKEYRVRPSFNAEFHCDRTNKDAQCIPVLPMALDFSAPIKLEDAKKIRLVSGRNSIKPALSKEDNKESYVQRITFNPPFAANTEFRLELPANLRDDAGRALTNAARFPLQVRTDDDPPIIKFTSSFGILESKADPAIAVTMRNVEPELAARLASVHPAGISNVNGSYVLANNPQDIIEWMRKLYALREGEAGKTQLLTDQEKPKLFKLPKPGGQRTFEVVGIPLKAPGFYVVELASPRLGAALFGEEKDEDKDKDKPKEQKSEGMFSSLVATIQNKINSLSKEKKPYYIQSAALVTNLAAHFKQGRESSLVWVTSLDKGVPVAGAVVDVRDCNGHFYWQGKTDAQGLARIEEELPKRQSLPGCMSSWDKQYFVTARLKDDFTFVFSDWNQGIDTWRFNLPQGDRQNAGLIHAVLDRMLFRAGETAHMKFIARRHTRSGFALPSNTELDRTLVLQHQGTQQEYEIPLSWDASGIAVADFAIPKEAKQGIYLLLSRPKITKYGGDAIGSFRVEAYRVPTMRATLQGPPKPLINAKFADVDVQVDYLSGGAAALLPVKLRSQVLPKNVQFADYDGFIFANGGVKIGKEDDQRRSAYRATEEDDDESAPSDDNSTESKTLKTLSFNLDAAGASRTTIAGLPKSEIPQELLAELEYRDANGETLTSSRRVALWPAAIIVGIKPDGWVSSKDHLKFQLLALDLAGKPAAGKEIKVDVLQREYFSHRRRLIGGFYAYEHGSEVKLLKTNACVGTSDAKGLVFCDIKPPASGNLIVVAEAKDDAGNIIRSNREMWVAGADDWWYQASDNDRMDVLPEKKHYEPGDVARFQVRTPFADAEALVTIEREGIIESYVVPLSRKNPVVDVPIKGNYAPNVFVSVLAVRGRIAGPAPTAMVDLAKPAFRLGIAEIKVGWGAHELKVKVTADRQVYKVRDKANIEVEVRKMDGSAPPKNSEIALVAVDEGLLELMGNNSWQLLDAMMKQRGIEVETATAQMQVVGKRHFGRKSVPAGGGGGRKSARELFDTLLFWKARVKLDEQGHAKVEVPLNDSLTSFRIVAVANGGVGLFGTGESTIMSTQDLMLVSGLPPLVREQDKFRAGFTVRNTSEKTIEVILTPGLTESSTHKPLLQEVLKPQTLTLNSGEAKEFGWDVEAPIGVTSVDWLVKAQGTDDAASASDVMKITQKIEPAVAVRTFQATIAQLDKPLEMVVALPRDAIPGRGGIRVQLQSKLADELAGVREYMSRYPYTCFEQRASVAVALRDEMQWEHVMANLPSYLDRDGLVKYFALMEYGSDTLTAYVLSIADEAGYKIPENSKARMEKALIGFIEGRIVRYSSLPTADLGIRKVAALAALSHGETQINPRWLDGFSIEPNLWPTSAVLDWYTLLKHAPGLAEGNNRLTEAEQILRSRLNFQGTTMTFSTERTDALWWLMTSVDMNANKVLLEMLDQDSWREDMPRLVRGALGRQLHGRWDTTVANAWGVLAMEKFSAKFESTDVRGKTSTRLGDKQHEHQWSSSVKKTDFTLPWPKGEDKLSIKHEGTGRPWAMVQSLAAIPLKEAFSSGYRITRTVTPIEQQKKGEWNRGDVLRVRLDLEAQSDMTWVVVNDPIPAGSAILGTGLGKDSKILTGGEKRKGWVWPAFEERTLDSFRAYYEFVPKGKWTVEYTLRLNNSGQFNMPETRVEAMYAPEMFGEIPNKGVKVGQ
jgi:uncharacterized protein YfaS (alpha-2-macroglobulin family)